MRTFLVPSLSQQLGEFFGGLIVLALSVTGGLVVRARVRRALPGAVAAAAAAGPARSRT
jgi:hypothetical protein